MFDAMLSRIGGVQERASVKTVFGEPYQVNGRTIIPVARIYYAFGFGGGHAGGRGTGAEPGDGGGGGGGAGVSARPVAVLEITAGETRVRPIVDATRLALTGMLVAAWAVFWITYTVRKAAGGR